MCVGWWLTAVALAYVVLLAAPQSAMFESHHSGLRAARRSRGSAPQRIAGGTEKPQRTAGLQCTVRYKAAVHGRLELPVDITCEMCVWRSMRIAAASEGVLL